METGNLEARVLVLEKEMQWTKGSMESIKTDLQELKSGQYRLLEHFIDLHRDMGELRGHTDERISDLEARTDERFSTLQAHTDERFSTLQAHTDERFSTLQAHTDERFITLQAHTDAQFVAVHHELAGLYGAMASQTRWILTAVLGAATMISLGLPVVFQLAKRYL